VLGGWVLLTSPASYAAHAPSTPVTLGGVMAASTIALYAMLGIESASVPAARVDNPGHVIPRATMVGTVTVAVIYIVVSAVPLLLLGQRELGAADAPFALLLDRFGAAGSGRWLALFVVISGLGALNGWTLLVGELTRTMASRRVLPALLARNNRHGAPLTALLVTGALASVMIWMSHSQSLVAAFTFLTLVVTAANLPAYLGCALALVVLWRRRMPSCAGRAVLLAASAGVVFVVFIFVGTGREPFLYALGLCAAGLPLYALMRLRRKALPAADMRVE
jgi:APA family basic amino acid/polyamine antiporter